MLAAAGLGSRRECEELITTGRVEIDRKTVTELGTRVDTTRQEIRVDGVALPRPRRQYFMLNKPPGVVSTNRDPSGRPRVIDLIQTDQRLFPVGRLDRTSEGLILVTNDGTLANGLTHPRYGVEKTYLAVIEGHPDIRVLDKLRQGVHLAEGVARAAAVHIKRRNARTTELIIVLDEGRNRQIRRMLARVGHKVLQLRRTAVGPVKLGDLPVGAYRRLTPDEVTMLEEAIRQRRKEQLKAKRDAKRRKPDGETENAEIAEGGSERTKPPARRPARGEKPVFAASDDDELLHDEEGQLEDEELDNDEFDDEELESEEHDDEELDDEELDADDEDDFEEEDLEDSLEDGEDADEAGDEDIDEDEIDIDDELNEEELT
ncbi:MAG TPA: pseudouridine synthase, partial [Pirellulaceae bacterium]|nr:pseudouridine synthase [Pirellulaceae bacterium]